MPVVEREVERLRVEFVLKTGEVLYLECDPEQGEAVWSAMKSTGMAAHPLGSSRWKFIRPADVDFYAAETLTRPLCQFDVDDPNPLPAEVLVAAVRAFRAAVSGG